jgi:hypothetical protein
MAADVKVAATKPKSSAADRKLHIHLVCITTGCVLAVIVSFVSEGMLFHIVPVLPALPSAVQEIVDRMFNW